MERDCCSRKRWSFFFFKCFIALTLIELRFVCEAFSASNRLNAGREQRPLHDGNNEDEEMRNLVEVGRRELQGLYIYPLDDWQLQAGGAIWEGHNVIVSAPTGAGKVSEQGPNEENSCCDSSIFSLALAPYILSSYQDSCR